MQMKGIIGEFGLVVISRSGHNAEKFVYESDKLFHLKVYETAYGRQYWFMMCASLLRATSTSAQNGFQMTSVPLK